MGIWYSPYHRIIQAAMSRTSRLTPTRIRAISFTTGFGIQSFAGGTSFVAPQLNGVSALLGQDLHSRLGLLNFPLYALAHGGKAYKNRGAPLRAIPYGDNWFYHGSYGYNLGVGLGTLDVANFAEYLRDQQ